MVDTVTGFKIMIIVMLFYSASISLVAYAIPTDARHYLNLFEDQTGRMDADRIGAQIESGLSKQTNIPVIEIGALVFYSGNILLDFILNFLFAVPEMIGFLFAGFLTLVNLPVGIAHIIQAFSSVAVMGWYVIGLIQMVTSVRSGRAV